MVERNKFASFYAVIASWENDFLLQSLYLQRHLTSGERVMQASEAFTGAVVGAGPSGLLARVRPDSLSPRRLLRAA
jgi:hypothetical protein